MKIKKPNLEEFFSLPNPGLRAYFQHTETGNPDDYRPPMWKGIPRNKVLEMWQKVFDTLDVKQKYPTLYDYEMEMKSKVGPMSIQQPLKDRFPETVERIESAHKMPKEPLMQEALDLTVKFFSRGGGIRLRDRKNVVRYMRLSTNSGPWLFEKRRRALAETLNTQIEVDTNTHQVYALVKGKRYHLAAVYGWRGQEGGPKPDDVKQRDVCMAAFLLNILELQYYQPFIESMQKHNLIPAYVSMDAVDKEVTQLFDTKGPDDLVICTDFKAFDDHFNSVMQDAAKYVHQHLMAPNPDNIRWLDEIYPAKFHLPIICSEHLMIEDPDIMESGSGGTNADECAAHKSLQFEACVRKGTTLNPHSMAYGDDGVLSAPGLTVEDVIGSYTRHGLNMNPSKQYASKHDCVVLRRWHSTTYRKDGIMVGVYSTFRALGRLLAQERFYDPEEWGPEQVELRTWSILENCNHSPYFEQFVDFVMQGDKYRLGLDLPGFMQNVSKIAAKSVEQLPDFLGYTKTLQQSDNPGITSWRIYKYLAAKQKNIIATYKSLNRGYGVSK